MFAFPKFQIFLKLKNFFYQKIVGFRYYRMHIRLGGNYWGCLHGCRRLPSKNTRSCNSNSNHGARSVTSEWKVQVKTPSGHSA